MAELLLYSRPGCHLCEVMRAELAPLLAGREVRLRLVNIDDDPVLKRRYGHDIPVLTDGDTELCRHFLDKEAVTEWLARRPG